MSFLELNEAKWLDSRCLALAKPTCRPPPNLMILTEVFFPLQSKHKATTVSQTHVQYSTYREAENHQSRFAAADGMSGKGSPFISLG